MRSNGFYLIGYVHPVNRQTGRKESRAALRSGKALRVFSQLLLEPALLLWTPTKMIAGSALLRSVMRTSVPRTHTMPVSVHAHAFHASAQASRVVGTQPLRAKAMSSAPGVPDLTDRKSVV